MIFLSCPNSFLLDVLGSADGQRAYFLRDHRCCGGIRRCWHWHSDTRPKGLACGSHAARRDARLPPIAHSSQCLYVFDFRRPFRPPQSPNTIPSLFSGFTWPQCVAADHDYPDSPQLTRCRRTLGAAPFCGTEPLISPPSFSPSISSHSPSLFDD